MSQSPVGYYERSNNFNEGGPMDAASLGERTFDVITVAQWMARLPHAAALGKPPPWGRAIYTGVHGPETLPATHT